MSRILICDDSLLNCRLLERACARLGLSCDVAKDSAAGLRGCRATAYGVVLMDELDTEGLFGSSGLKTAALIRSLPPPFCSPRLVLMTARPFSGLSLEDLFSAGHRRCIAEAMAGGNGGTDIVRQRPRNPAVLLLLKKPRGGQASRPIP